MTDSVLHVVLAHHVWANVRLLEVCAALDEAQLATTVPGTYGSVLDTLRHLVGGDSSYLELLTDGRVRETEEATMDVPALREVAAAHGPVWEELLAAALDPDRVVTRVREDGSRSGATLGVRVAQVPHHGTDHRSQVCTALTQLGVEPPELDVWAWADERGELTVTEGDA